MTFLHGNLEVPLSLRVTLPHHLGVPWVTTDAAHIDQKNTEQHQGPARFSRWGVFRWVFATFRDRSAFCNRASRQVVLRTRRRAGNPSPLAAQHAADRREQCPGYFLFTDMAIGAGCGCKLDGTGHIL